MSIKTELEAIAAKNGGLLLPEAVIEAARDPASELHSRFCWDDAEAAHAHRLWQARQIVASVRVTAPELNGTVVRAFVSLRSDREAGGGYRSVTGVAAQRNMANELADEMHQRIEYWRRQAEALGILVSFSGALDLVEQVRTARPITGSDDDEEEPA